MKIVKFSSEYKNIVKDLFSEFGCKVRAGENKNSIEIMTNQNNKIIIEKSKYDCSVQVYIKKENKPETLLRSIIIVLGNKQEKDIFYKCYNKIYYESEGELINFFIFLKKKYIQLFKRYFEDSEVEAEIITFFENLTPRQFKSTEDENKWISETIFYSKKIKFSKDGEVYLNSV